MKKRNCSLLLAGALALTLCACAPGGGSPDSAPSAETAPASSEPSGPALSTPAPEPSPPAEPSQAVELDGALPERDYQPWQTAYMDFLTLLQTQKTTWEPGGVGAEVGSESYSLYDVDKDGIPELFVKFGTCEADFFARCYTLYTDMLGKDVVVMAAQFPFGHSSLYTCPDKNGFLRSEGHMGYHEIYEYGPLENGELSPEREIFSEGEVWEYTEVDEIVPGAEYIDYYYTQLGEYDLNKGYAPESEWYEFDDGRPHASGSKALLLPIADYDHGPAATGNSSERARTAILAALNGETQLYGASGDHFYGDMGWISWEDYVQPGAACPYNGEPLEIAAHVWLDMNGDGQEECVLWLEAQSEENSQGAVVLSEQDGTVYAYYFGFYFFGHEDGAVLCTDGTVRNTYAGGGTVRLSFWKDQCYERAAPETSAPAVEWVDGSPAG